ncbi:MAG: ABC transporter ATP-binding protein [Bacteroidia bacterium]
MQIEHLSKQYRLGTIGTGTLGHDLNRWWHLVRGKADPYRKLGEENNREAAGRERYVWALKDVSFNVEQGEVIGIIGNNGAGKSTLLKILSRITAPTEGVVKVNGRIASLLEVGTGFHPELTGEENIFLNGAILGMSRQEIKNKFDEIVSFSGTARYIKTPVKRYSSGMRVRLAFAVAAHLDPDILVVDEVLAVGDADFQKKALGKLQSVSSQTGKTVLFVSHNMEAINRLCQRGLVLDKGKLVFSGTAAEAIQAYSTLGRQTEASELRTRTDRSGKGDFKFTNAWIENEHHQRIADAETGSALQIKVLVEPQKDTLPIDAYASVIVRDAFGARLFTLSAGMLNKRLHFGSATLLSFNIAQLPLPEGQYNCDLYLAEQTGGKGVQDSVHNAFPLSVFGNDFFKTGQPQAQGLDKFFVGFTVVAGPLKEHV